MGNAKVVLNNVTLIDLTSDTVTTGALLSGYTAHGSNGESITGAYIPVSASLIAGSTNPSENAQHIMPPSGYDGFSYFDVGAIDSNYVGSNVPARGAGDLSASGSIVTVSSGYYSSEATKAVSAGSATTPATTISVTPTINVNTSTGVITSTAAGSSSITPTVSVGYVNSGTAGIVSVSGTNTSQLSTQTTKTVTPTESEQTAVEANKYTTGVVKVAAIPSDYVGSNIAQNTSGDIIVAGPTVTIPNGYYSSDVSTVISNAAFESRINITGTPYITINNNGLISASYQAGQYTNPIITSGYTDSSSKLWFVSAGSSTYQLTTASASTYTPSSAMQSIPSGVYLTGVQTIAGDSNLVAGNIVTGVTLFGVSGTAPVYEFMTTEEIWYAAASGWGVEAVMSDAAIAAAVSSGWG